MQYKTTNFQGKGKLLSSSGYREEDPIARMGRDISEQLKALEEKILQETPETVRKVLDKLMGRVE